MLAFGRLLERALHDVGPWGAIVHGDTECLMIVRKQVLPGQSQIVFTGYLPPGCQNIYLVELVSRGEFVTAQDVTGSPSSPCRITFSVGIPDAVRAA